jgi:ribosomal protein L23
MAKKSLIEKPDEKKLPVELQGLSSVRGLLKSCVQAENNAYVFNVSTTFKQNSDCSCNQISMYNVDPIKVSVSVKKAIATNVRGVVGKTKLEKKATVYLPKNEKIEIRIIVIASKFLSISISFLRQESLFIRTVSESLIDTEYYFMAIKKYKPTSASRRSMTGILYPKRINRNRTVQTSYNRGKRHVGRNHHGRITAPHKGGGHKRSYREIDFKMNENQYSCKNRND